MARRRRRARIVSRDAGPEGRRWRAAVARAALAVAAVWIAQPRPGLPPIPFAGCPADGQEGHVGPPSRAARPVTLRDLPAGTLAWYQGASGPGAFAPRGWHCQRWYGPSGSTLVVTPEPVGPAFPPRRIRGQAVELEFAPGATDGRFAGAVYAARLFPGRAASFVARVRSEGLLPASAFRRGPYDDDALAYPEDNVAAFTTPARLTGLGTAGYLDPSGDAIRGLAILYDSGTATPDVAVLRVRLGARLRALEDGILRLARP